MTKMIGCGCNVPKPPPALTGYVVYHGAATRVIKGGRPIIALYGPMVGGMIYNPIVTQEQGISPLAERNNVHFSPVTGPINTYAPNSPRPVINALFRNREVISVITYSPPEPLYVDLTGPAALGVTETTVAILPGQSFTVPPGFTGNVWVNAKTSGHTFACIVVQPVTQFPPQPFTGLFPPDGPTGKTTTIPSYLYEQYNDDDDLISFIAAYNSMTQQYVDYFNALNLPNYTVQSGTLLDWICTGLYDIPRPTLFSGKTYAIGPINTFGPNGLPGINTFKRKSQYANIAVTSDDVYKRIVTWHFYKADGRQIAIRWLKRRIGRFLYGVNGTDYSGPTDQISILLGTGTIAITIVTGRRSINLRGGAMPGSYQINKTVINTVQTTLTMQTTPAMAAIFQEAIQSGALEMPYQYNTTCRIGILGE